VCQFRFELADWSNKRDLFWLKDQAKVQDYIEHIKYAITNYNVQLVVLPELSIPFSYLNELQQVSKQQKTIIVGGSHYYEDDGNTIARCPIIINGDIFFTEKINPSPFEISPIIGHGISQGEHFKIFKNTTIGNFAVIICADYLDSNIRTKIAAANLDFVIIIAFQKESILYHDRMNVGCEELDVGSYFIYSNILCDTMADGRSGLFGIMDKIFFNKLINNGWTNGEPKTKLIELTSDDRLSYFVATIDVRNKKPSFLRNIFTKPNISIQSKEISTQEYEKIENKKKRLKLLTENIKKRRSDS